VMTVGTRLTISSAFRMDTAHECEKETLGRQVQIAICQSLAYIEWR